MLMACSLKKDPSMLLHPSASLTREDILPLEAYEKMRLEKRPQILALKKRRRLPVGPYAVFLFENRETLWWQIQEMLRIEKGGEAQISDELAAYAPLVPQGSEWVATLMFEIEDPKQRLNILRQLGHVEKAIRLHLKDHTILAVPTDAEERTDAAGKTSAVHFLRFPFTLTQKELVLQEPSPSLTLEISHPAYAYSAVMPPTLISEIKRDFVF